MAAEIRIWRTLYSNRPRWHAHQLDAVRRIPNDDGARTDCAPTADRNSWDDRCARACKHPFSDTDLARNSDAGRQVRVRSDHAIMIDARGRVENAVLTHACVRVHRHVCKHHDTLAKDNALRKRCSRMDDGCEFRPGELQLVEL